MKFKILLVLSFSTFFTAALKAQNTPQARISGYAIDKNTLKPIPGISIKLESTNKGTTTDSTGFFRITNITPGSYNISFSILNYNAKTINNVVLTSGNETTISVELEMAAKKLDEIVITNRLL